MGQPQKVSNTLVWTTPTSGRGVGRPPTLGVGATKSGAPPKKNTFLNDPPPGGRGDKIHSPPPKYIFWTAITPAGTGHSAPRCCSPRGWGFVQKVYSEGGGADFVAPYPRGGVGGFVQKVFGGGRRIFPLYPQGWGGVQISVLGGVAPDFVAPYSPGVGGGVVHGKVFWGWRRIFSTLPPRRWGWGVGQTSVFGGEGAGFRRPLPPRGGGGVVHKNVFWGWRQIFAALHFPLAAPSAPPFFPSGACCAATFLTAPAAPQFPRRGACGAAV